VHGEQLVVLLGLTTCSPGCASSARMIIAIAPAAMKNQNDVKR
jgi:hypothetical protein